MTALTKVTVNLTRRAHDAVVRAGDKTGDSRTDTICRAVQVYDLVLDLLERGDGRLVVRHPDGTHETVTIL